MNFLKRLFFLSFALSHNCFSAQAHSQIVRSGVFIDSQGREHAFIKKGCLCGKKYNEDSETAKHIFPLIFSFKCKLCDHSPINSTAYFSQHLKKKHLKTTYKKAGYPSPYSLLLAFGFPRDSKKRFKDTEKADLEKMCADGILVPRSGYTIESIMQLIKEGSPQASFDAMSIDDSDDGALSAVPLRGKRTITQADLSEDEESDSDYSLASMPGPGQDMRSPKKCCCTEH